MTDSRRPSAGPSRIGSMLVAVGCLGVLAATFTVGFYTGRYWTRAARGAGDGSPAVTASAPPAPSLTFYEELMAPLPSPRPPAKPVPESKRPAERAAAPPERPVERASTPPARHEERAVKSEKRPAEAPARPNEAAGPRLTEPSGAGSRFTVQIAAYSARASAEALRNTINASGHEAYIVESDSPPGAPRYRVRIGSYPSREAAVAAAARLPVPGGRYVTTR